MHNTTLPLDPVEPDDLSPSPVKKEFVDHRAKDHELYQQWAKTKSKSDMGKLVQHLSPLIYKEVSRASGSLPTSALNAEAKVWTAKAIQTYEPDRGVALATHVMNYLPKVRRMNYKYQNAVRLPENMQLQFHEYNKHLTQLTDELNRDPTEEEMAQRLGWSKGTVVRFKNSLYADLTEDGDGKDSEMSSFTDKSILMNHLLAQLTPQESFLFHNKDKMTAVQLAAQLGVNTNRLNYLQKKLLEKVKKLKEELEL
jgi:DNA-directed RNA polymerase specialized sigma subunit